MAREGRSRIDRWVACVTGAMRDGLLVEAPQGVLTGLSGRKLVGLLQRLAASIDDEGSCYLEVGVFQGLTLLSTALASRRVPCFGIDNFAFFDPEGRNLEIVQERRRRLGLDNAHLVNAGFEDALADLRAHIGPGRVAVYFVDGPHDYRSQLLCLEFARPYLGDGAVIIVDDCNYRHVRQANADFLRAHPEFRLLFEAYTPCHPLNMTSEALAQAKAGWWNGVNVLVHDPAGLVTRSFPPTERSRTLYENEHVVHASPLGHCAPEAVELVAALASLNPIRIARALVRLRRSLARAPRPGQSVYPSANTYSAQLPAERLASIEPGD